MQFIPIVMQKIRMGKFLLKKNEKNFELKSATDKFAYGKTSQQ